MSYQQELVPAKAPEQVARGIILDMKAWAAACPRYRQALEDCIEEIAWEAKLPPAAAAAPQDYRACELKHGANQILTTLSLWAELNPRFTRHLRACVEEIKLLAGRPERPQERARDAVLDALAQGYQTCPQIAEYKGLCIRTVQYNVQRLIRLKLVRDMGCAARVRRDGCRTRLYELTHQLPVTR